jgi:hypothetical protein
VLVFVLFVDQKRWSEMFPGIVAGVTANGAISGGVLGSRIQLVCSVRMHIPFDICVFLASDICIPICVGRSTDIVEHRSSTCR